MTKNKIYAVLASLAFALTASAQNPVDSARVVTLGECLELAGSCGYVSANAELDVKAAKARKQEALSHFFPTVNAAAFGFKSLDPMAKIGAEDILGTGDVARTISYYFDVFAGLAGINNSFSLLSNGYIAAVNVMQPVFAGGRIVNGNILASLGVEASEIKREMAARDVADEVEKKYWATLSLSGKKAALEQAIELVRNLQKDVEAALGAGIAGESDLLQVKLKSRQLESQMAHLRAGEKLAKMDLFNYIGLPYSYLSLDSLSLEKGSAEDLRSPDSYYRSEDDLARSLAESRLLELNVKAKKLEKKMALGEALPSVGVGGFYGYYKMVGDPMRNGALFASVSIPLSDWGKTSRQMERIQCEIDKAGNEKEYLDSQLSLKVRKEWIDLQTAWDDLQAAVDEVSIAELLESQKRSAYEAGMCTMSELLQCQTDLQLARTSAVDAEIAYRTALGLWLK